MSQRNQHLTDAMLRKLATTTPKQVQTTWCFGEDWQHAGGAIETFNQQPCSPESCHSVTLARVLLFVKAAPFSQKRSLQQSHFRGRKHIGFFGLQEVVLPSSARGCLCHPSGLLWFHGFWRTFAAAGCVPSVMSQPQKQDCHTLQRVDLARPFLVSPAIK